MGIAAVPVLWVLQMGTAGTVDASGHCTVPMGTAGYVGTVTVGYCGYCRWVPQGTAERTEC